MKELICPICKKNFIPAHYHIYVKNEITYCSWHCYYSVDKQTKQPAKSAMSVSMKNKDGETLKVFESAKNAAEQTGFRASGIRDACREKRPYMKYLWEYL